MDAVAKAVLRSSYFEKIIAQLGPGMALKRGGQIDTEITSQVLEVKDNPKQAIAKVGMSTTAVSTEAKDDSQYSFKMELVIVGMYEWPTLDKRPNLEDDNVTSLLCQPLYVQVVSQAGDLARRLNMGNLNIPWAYGSLGDEEPAGDSKVSAKNKAVSSRVAKGRKAATAKP